MDGPSGVVSGRSARLLHGSVLVHPRTAEARARPRLDRSGPSGWIVLDEPELRLGSDIVTPGLAGWRREAMPNVPRGPFVTLAPGWVADGPSLGHDREASLALYARRGVDYLWWIDASSRTLEVLHHDGSAWEVLAVHRGNAVVRAEPFDALEIPLPELWASL